MCLLFFIYKDGRLMFFFFFLQLHLLCFRSWKHLWDSISSSKYKAKRGTKKRIRKKHRGNKETVISVILMDAFHTHTCSCTQTHSTRVSFPDALLFSHLSLIWGPYSLFDTFWAIHWRDPVERKVRRPETEMKVTEYRNVPAHLAPLRLSCSQMAPRCCDHSLPELK